MSGFRCCADHGMIHTPREEEDLPMKYFFADADFFSFPYLKRMTSFSLKKLKVCEENAGFFS